MNTDNKAGAMEELLHIVSKQKQVWYLVLLMGFSLMLPLLDCTCGVVLRGTEGLGRYMQWSNELLPNG